jgi:hypothetical protein
MLKLLFLAMLCGSASAQTLYKCSVGGKITYSGKPCAGKVTEIEVPPAPAPNPDAAKELARDKTQSARLQKERQAREAQEQRDQALLDRTAGARAQRCAKLRLQKKWADEEAGKAVNTRREAAQDKARKQAELMALECPV